MKPLVLAGRTATLLLALIFTLALVGERAIAQDAELESRAEERQREYVEAVTSGDVDAFVAMFTEDAVIMPMSGGTFEGQEGVRRYFEEERLAESQEIRSERVERIGDLVLDIGTFRLTTTAEAGGREIEGEYLVLAREENGELMIHRLIVFPPRQVPPQ